MSLSSCAAPPRTRPTRLATNRLRTALRRDGFLLVDAEERSAVVLVVGPVEFEEREDRVGKSVIRSASVSIEVDGRWTFADETIQVPPRRGGGRGARGLRRGRPGGGRRARRVYFGARRMSVAPRRPPGRDEVRRLATTFHANLWGSLVLCAAIHVSAPLFLGDELIRFALVIVFFAALASVTWSLSTPFAEYTRARLRLRYAAGGPSIQNIAERYAIRLTRLLATFSGIGTLGVSLVGAAVAVRWPLLGDLSGLSGPLGGLGVLALVALPVYALLSAGRIREIAAMRQQLEEEAAIAGIVARAPEEDAAAERWQTDAPVVLIGPQVFRAGGYDWRYDDFYKNAAIFGQSGDGQDDLRAQRAARWARWLDDGDAGRRVGARSKGRLQEQDRAHLPPTRACARPRDHRSEPA